MDFDTNLLSSHSAAAAFSLQDAADMNKQKCYGFGFLKQDRAINEEDLRELKMAKTSSFAQRSNGSTLSNEGYQQMLSFSSPTSHPTTSPYYPYASSPFGRNTGGGMEGLKGPFTPSQWMELEHQALIYKYITANVPIPSYLLNPIRKAFDSAGFPVLRSNPLGWGGFQLGFSNSDPEPGRCRRTDGKKWRCSRDAVVDQKYCERHMNRGRHRSRKPVETQPTPSIAKPTSNNQASSILTATSVASNKHYAASIQEFGLVCSDSLLNPLNRTEPNHELRQFMDEWPNANQPGCVDLQPERTQLSISIQTATSDFMSSTSSPANGASPPGELEMGLGVGSLDVDRNQSQIPITWEPTSIGGPLGEVLHNTSNGIGNAKQLNLIERWDNRPRLASSPTGVLQRGAFVSLSNSE